MSQPETYKNAGVDIEAADQAIKQAKSAIEKTHNERVLTSIGGFASLYDLKALSNDYDHPVLVQSIDGVGTKSQVAALTGNYAHIGQDLVSATCNDIIVTGAKPLTLLDYVASDHLEPQIISTIIKSIAHACAECDTALVGGETAEMPGIYHANEQDIVGVVTGVVDKDNMIDGPNNIRVGDKIIGIFSSGLHTNGFSLARHVLLKQHNLALDKPAEGFSQTLGDVLLTPHINYTKPIISALEQGCDIHGMAHITGGGLINNLPRVLPQNTDAIIDCSTWQPLPIFNLIQSLGNVPFEEMYQVFNMGIGFVCILDDGNLQQLETILKDNGLAYATIGHIAVGQQQVRLNPCA